MAHNRHNQHKRDTNHPELGAGYVHLSWITQQLYCRYETENLMHCQYCHLSNIKLPIVWYNIFLEFNVPYKDFALLFSMTNYLLIGKDKLQRKKSPAR